jgi:hypothetical protein
MVKDKPVDLVVVFLFEMEVEPLGIQPGSPNCVAVAADAAAAPAAAVEHVQHELVVG